jgi:hypothetical protein
MLHAGLRPDNKFVTFLKGCLARLPGKAAVLGCRAKVHAMVQYEIEIGQ